uniref:Retinoic acid receptor responder protein 2 n=1 Tax=Pundamilia nyererei TaxID=303518 RepID=A0A3B4F0J0_9CICH
MINVFSFTCDSQSHNRTCFELGSLFSKLLSSQTQRKMAASLLLLVCAVAVLYSAEAQDSYNGLPEIYKKGVDLAMQQLSTHARVQHHYRFLKTVGKLETEGGFGMRYFYHHFHLKPTRCPKGTTETDPQRCPYRNDRPLMDCAVCYKTSGEQIEAQPNPYVHCIQKPRFTEEMKKAREDHYKKMVYHSGAPTLLAVKT